MGIITKVIKYGIVFATGYYLGLGGCDSHSSRIYKKPSWLEQEVMKYEQKIDKSQEARAKLFP